MADLNTKYLGLNLRNPIVAASSGLTDSLKNIVELDRNGVGAVVLKSIFEEQILLEADYRIKQAQKDEMTYADYSETLDYIDVHVKEKELTGYLNLIQSAKEKTDIPIIASINAITGMEWTSFAREIEQAGADALELNIFVMPFNQDKECGDNENVYYDILKKVKEQVKLPVSVKISPYFSNLGKVIKNLEANGAEGVVLFNRFANPDIDIHTMKVTPTDVLSHASDMGNVLRWMAIMHQRVNMSLAASTGIHDGEAVIKQLLAGATVVQVASAFYQHGLTYVLDLLKFVDEWMEGKGFNYVDQFRGKLSQASTENPDVYERMQFMKYFSDIK
ncbi:MAG: dihydroorotate dehydrogenase-like protein [Bacteroidales bacterium]|nr:dihydroorotate dehydrogenase-like protein [Bacteroidales bacterium]